MTRELLPQRRGGLNFEFVHRNIAYTATIGFYEDGRIAEIFVSGTKAGTDVQIVANEAAVAISIALQYGCPMETIREAVPRNEDGTPQGLSGALLDAAAAIVTDRMTDPVADQAGDGAS